MTAENNGLKTENAELRKERDFYFNQVIENGGRAQRAIDALNDENAKLRELVEDMLDCIDIQIAFERVPARWMREEFAGRARELRIEVDDA